LIIKTDKQEEIDKYIRAFESVHPFWAFGYISVPITTGKKLLEWYDRKDFTTEMLIAENLAEANIKIPQYIECFNRYHKSEEITFITFIDPTKIKEPKWRQQDYLSLWEQVITKFVKCVLFADNWQYSNGCCYEFLISKRLNLPTYTPDSMVIISIEEGIRLINEAIKEIRKVNDNTLFLERVIDNLGEIK
jgi:hypothetical protein